VELPTVELVALFKRWEFVGFRWEWLGLEVGVLEGVNSVDAAPPVESEKLSEE
jgi:hypothetical protein